MQYATGSVNLCFIFSPSVCFLCCFFFSLYFSSRKAPETTSEQNFSQKGLSKHMFLPGPMPSDGQGTQ